MDVCRSCEFMQLNALGAETAHVYQPFLKVLGIVSCLDILRVCEVFPSADLSFLLDDLVPVCKDSPDKSHDLCVPSFVF